MVSKGKVPDSETPAPLPPSWTTHPRKGVYLEASSQGTIKQIAIDGSQHYVVGSVKVGDGRIVVAHPSVSRHHAMLVHIDTMVQVRDLTSTNGTFIEQNGRSTRLRCDFVTICAGTSLRFGSCDTKFILRKPAEALGEEQQNDQAKETQEVDLKAICVQV